MDLDIVGLVVWFWSLVIWWHLCVSEKCILLVEYANLDVGFCYQFGWIVPLVQDLVCVGIDSKIYQYIHVFDYCVGVCSLLFCVKFLRELFWIILWSVKVVVVQVIMCLYIVLTYKGSCVSIWMCSLYMVCVCNLCMMCVVSVYYSLRVPVHTLQFMIQKFKYGQFWCYLKVVDLVEFCLPMFIIKLNQGLGVSKSIHAYKLPARAIHKESRHIFRSKLPQSVL